MKLCGLVVVEDGVPSRSFEARTRVPALEHIANRPIIEQVLDGLEHAGVEEVLVASSVAIAHEIRERLEPRGAEVRYLEQEAPLDLPTAIRIAAPAIGEAPCIVHRATGLLDEPLGRFVGRLRDAPDALLIVHQASSPDEHLSPATQDMLHLAEFNADHALGMAGVWMFGPGAMPIVASSP